MQCGRSTHRCRGYHNVILSNHAPELPQLVTALGLGDWIETTITSAALGTEKPNPRIFERAIEITRAGDDVWMVGDNPVADIAGAEGVGIRAIQIGPTLTLTDAAIQIVESTTEAQSPEDRAVR